LHDATYFVVDAQWNGDVTLDPWFVVYYWDLDWWKEVVMKATALGVVPCEPVMLETHQMVHECALGRPKEVCTVEFIDILTSLVHVSSCCGEWWGKR